MKLAFLGAGNMAGAIIKSALRGGVLNGNEILCVNARNPEHGRQRATELGIQAAGPEALATADAVVFAMKPQDFAQAAAMYRPCLKAGQLILSIMAGISFQKMEKELGAFPMIRVGVGRGVTGYAVGAGVTEEQAAFAEKLLAAGGMAIRLQSEAEIAKVIGVAGSSPAYFCLLLEALAEAAVRDGMAPDAAALFARETMIGTAELLKAEPTLTATELRARISSKKGTTEAAVEAMRAAGFEEAVAAGYVRAVQKSDAMTATFDAE